MFAFASTEPLLLKKLYASPGMQHTRLHYPSCVNAVHYT